MRRFVREKTISIQRADQAIQDLLDLRMMRYAHFLFLSHIWQLRHNLSAYDAAYVSLAKELGATLLTRDAGLASAASRVLNVQLF